MRILASLSTLAFGLALFSPSTQAYPLTQNDTSVDGEFSFLQRRAPGDFYLRIMPLGASITAGEHESREDNPINYNGYRKYLRDKLRTLGWDVNMVGSQQSGRMADSDHEGVSGDKVRRVHERGVASARLYKPNIILINAGTNDARDDFESDPVASVGKRMEDMILALFAAVDVPPGQTDEQKKVVIILSTLLPCPICDGRERIANAQYRNVVGKLAGEGRRILLAEMDDGDFITPNMIHDRTHPNAEGQRRMAAVWNEAIGRAVSKGWVVEPQDTGANDSGSNYQCEKVLGSGNSNGRSGWQVLAAGNPLISDDGRYRHASIRHGNVHESRGNRTRAQSFHFANLWKANIHAEARESRDELVIIERLSRPIPGDDIFVQLYNRLRWWKNNGGSLESTPGGYNPSFEFPQECEIGGIHFGDVDGDGYDDLLCVADSGHVDLYRHNGQNSFLFEARRTFRNARPGCRRENVRFGDIDGDGRLDYCCIGFDGNIFCARNGYREDPGAQRWQDLGTVFTAKGMGDIRGVRFVDVNGDGRSDWIWLAENGRSVIYINQRGNDKSLIPLWTQAEVSHGGGFENLHDPGSRSRIQFGRFFGSGRYDYMVIEANGGCPDSTCSRVIHAYENKGTGGRFQKGDGAYWGDMRGRGVDDYIWISPDGVVNLFPNQNTKEDTATRGDVHKGIWGGVFAPIHTGKDRRSLHIADWNGDGKDDIISVDKWTGHLTIWLSNWNGNTYNPTIIHRNSRTYCQEGWGVGYFDTGHHFADITGDGKADYLCMSKNGFTRAWVNHGNQELLDVGQVKFSEDLDRENYRFADVNGDKKVDMIWLDKFGGNARVWQNIEYLEHPDDRVSGSKVRWNHIGPRYLQSARGANIHFPNLGGQGRADMVEVRADTAHGFAWFNMCASGGADDANMSDPNLPAYTPKNPDPDDGTVNDPFEEDFCNAEVQDWNANLWRRMNMDGWLSNRLNDYAVSPAWPDASSPHGVPSIISEYQLFTRDNKFSWKDDCQGIDQQCSIGANDIKGDDRCPGRSQRGFFVWAAKNYARYLNSFYNSLRWSVVSGSLRFGSYSEDFAMGNVADQGIGLSSWYTIANGILSTIVAFVPGGPANVAITALGGLSGLAGTVSSFFEDAPEDDHQLKVWRDLGLSFSKALEESQTIMYDHFDKMLAEKPADRDRSVAESLKQIFRNGAFADASISGAQTFHPATQANLMKAAAVSALWNQQSVFLFRFDEPIVLRDGFSYDPCNNPGNVVDNGFEHNTHCINGVNYIILRWEMNYDGFVRREFGQGDDNLDKHDIDRADIYEGSWKLQERLRNFPVARPRNVFARHMETYVRDNVSPQSKDLVQWTIPVCNWGSIQFKTGLPVNCRTNYFCLYDLIVDNCPRMFYSGDDGANFPYIDHR